MPKPKYNVDADSILELLELFHHLSLHDTKSVEQLQLKIAEEHGEIARALLQLRHERGREGKSDQQIKANVAEECCDTAIAALTLALRFGRTNTIKKLLLKKLVRRMKGAKVPPCEPS